MNIVKFNQYLLEAQRGVAKNRPIVVCLVLDMVIDDNGNLYNGTLGNNIIKGNVVRDKNRKIIGIKGDDNKNYPAGIDKTGNLIALEVDDEDFVLNSNKEKIRIPAALKRVYPGKFTNDFWRVHKEGSGYFIDYSFTVPILPTGWVNVKIDMEIVKRVRRYSRGLGSNNRGFDSFINKLKDLQRISKGVRQIERTRETIQKQMSVIILLHYINEVKNFFTPSSAGFLFESFLAGMIPGSGIKDDNTAADVVANGKRYQVKLYSELQSNLAVTYEDDGRTPMDYYLIGIKYPDKIILYVLQGHDPDIDDYYGEFTTETVIKNGKLTGGNFSLKKIKTLREDRIFTIELLGIENKIENIKTGLKSVLDKLYGELSKFEYNLETIMTGVDEHGNIINGTEFEFCSANANHNLEVMENELGNLITTLSPNLGA